jgi:AraC family transcriptional regulator of adaptative response/methylated-DNA-[protein]-cysteine methyltransferase
MMTDHTDATCYSTEQARWDALVQRSPQADGAFVYGVATTGVYCRPVCPSRLPNRDNVWFFDSFEEAERAGYRPCKRCMPNAPVRQEPQRKAILQACQIIAEAEEPPTLADLAYAVGLSSSHLHRVFKRIIGVTPKQYAMEKRLERVRDNLERSSTVTDAIYEAGFASSSRFYERAADTLGMAPSAYQNGGRGEFIRYGIQQCSLGWVLVAATDKGICTIDLGDTPEAMVEGLRARFPEAKLVDGGAGFDARMAQVLSFLDAPQDGLTQGGARSGAGLRVEPDRGGHTVPSRGAERWEPGWVPVGGETEAPAIGARGAPVMPSGDIYTQA